MARYRYCHEKKKVVPAEEAVPRSGHAVQVVGGADFRLKSHFLPLNWPYAPRHDKEGRACFQSLKEVREAVARANHDGEAVSFHRGPIHYGD